MWKLRRLSTSILPVWPYKRLLHSSGARLGLRIDQTLAKLKPTCVGCRVPFQHFNSEAPGYVKPVDKEGELLKRLTANELVGEGSSKVTDLMSDMSPEAKSALLNGSDVSQEQVSAGGQEFISEKHLKKGIKLIQKNEQKKFCLWCTKSSCGNEFHTHAPVQDKHDILAAIPERATILHVIDGNDFPATLDQEIVKPRQQQVLYIVTKVDRVTSKHQSKYELALDYFRHVLSEYGVPRDKVFCLDLIRPNRSLAMFNEIINRLGSDNYLVGHANVGKTFLANQLVRRIKGDTEHKARGDVWANPWITQLPQTWRLKRGDKQVYVTDLMSYPEPKAVYYALKQKFARAMCEGAVLFKPPFAYASRRLVISRPNQVMSIGGVVAFRCKTATLIGWPVVPKSNQISNVVSTIDRVRELNVSQNRQHLLRSIVSRDYADRELELSKTFRVNSAGTTIALRGLGVVHFHVNGRIPDGGAEVEAFVIPGVDLKLMDRPNILPYISNKIRAPDQRVQFLTWTNLNRFIRKHPEHEAFMHRARMAYASRDYDTLHSMFPVEQVIGIQPSVKAGELSDEARETWNVIRRDLINMFGANILKPTITRGTR